MSTEPAARVKCVVWDLDDTLWDGTLTEGGGHALRPGVPELLAALDGRGVLLSVASKNDPTRAMARLRELGVDHWFLHPQISWEPKSTSVRTIAERLNIGLDTLMFIDDSPFERAEVSFAYPQLRCVDSAELDGLLDRPEFDLVLTEEARNRRRLYQQAEVRQEYEDGFQGPRTDFLASLDMRLTVAPATAEDLLRAAELTQRTHQLNTTGLVFSPEELAELRTREDQTLLVVSLRDRFGPYGIVGVVLLGAEADEWRIRLLLMSCRVMGRNIGGAVLSFLAGQAEARGRTLTADLRPNEVNRPMYMVYRLAGFVDAGGEGDVRRLRLRAGARLTCPDYIHLRAPVLPLH